MVAIKPQMYGGAYALPGIDGSEIFLDPFKRLGAAVCTKALADLHSSDLLTSLGALSWFLDDGPAWLYSLGIIGDHDNPDTIFRSILKAKTTWHEKVY